MAIRPLKEFQTFLEKLLQSPPALPFEPALLPMLFAVTSENSTSSTNELVALIERSQKLTTRVLSIANSAAYGLEFKVTSLNQAVNILGIREIRVLAILVGVASLVKSTKLPSRFDLAALWTHQLKVAVIAKALSFGLAEASGVCSGPFSENEDRLSMAPDEAYIVGLLHDIGKIFFAAARPDLWEAVDDMSKKDGCRYFEAENAYWGADHSLIGATVLHHWKFPLLLTEPVNWHHAPELAPEYKMETRLLAAADHIAHSDADAGGALCQEAVALLPDGSDTTGLAELVSSSLADLKANELKRLS